MSTELIVTWCNRIIRSGFYLLFGLVPLLLTPWNYELFEYNKMMAVYALTLAIVGSWLVKSIAQKQFRIAKTPLDIPILLFLSSQLLSTFFSIDPHVSWFGYYSRFNGGMWSVISYVLLYYAFVSNWTEKTVLPILKISLSTATIISLYALAERLGVDKHLWVQDVQNRVFSTLGQPNWLAAYVVALAPITMTMTMLNAKWPMINKKPSNILFIIWHLALVILFFLVLLFTRSRSGLLAFALADIVFWGLLFWKSKVKLSLRFPFIICHLAFIIVFLLNGTEIPILKRAPATQLYTAPLLESGGTESGVIRKYVWQGAIAAWKSSTKTLLIGTGTETFAFAFYQFRPPGHNLTSEWDFLYNKAHNEYLNYLATTGIFGLGSYLLFIVAFIVWFAQKISKPASPAGRQIPIRQLADKSQLGQLEIRPLVSVALFAGWLSVLITNFFGFSVVITQVFLFLFPAMIFSFGEKELKSRIFALRLNSKVSQGFFLALLLVLLALLVLLSMHWYADTLFATGYRFNRAGTYEQARMLLSRARALNPKEPFYHDELGVTLSGLAVVAIEAHDATSAAKLAQESIKENDTAILISPKNVNFWKSRTKIFYAFSTFDAQFNTAAIGALEHALELSPNDPKIIYNLAILYGRQGNNAKAIELLKHSIDLKRDYRDAYYALSIFYTETKQPDLARAVLREYLDRVNPNDKDFQSRINTQ